jgi:hypothetical protein
MLGLGGYSQVRTAQLKCRSEQEMPRANSLQPGVKKAAQSRSVFNTLTIGAALVATMGVNTPISAQRRMPLGGIGGLQGRGRVPISATAARIQRRTYLFEETNKKIEYDVFVSARVDKRSKSPLRLRNLVRHTGDVTIAEISASLARPLVDGLGTVSTSCSVWMWWKSRSRNSARRRWPTLAWARLTEDPFSLSGGSRYCRGRPAPARGPSSIKTRGSVAGSLKIDHNSEFTPPKAARYRHVCTESIRLRMKIRRT